MAISRSVTNLSTENTSSTQREDSFSHLINYNFNVSQCSTVVAKYFCIAICVMNHNNIFMIDKIMIRERDQDTIFAASV